MRLRVLFFARGRELAGTSETTLDLPEGSTTESLLERLLAQYPGLAQLEGRFVLSLNQEYLAQGEAAPLKEGDEVALIPPISGG